MKKILLISTALLLVSCSSPSPTLLHTAKPILNIESRLEHQLSAKLYSDSADVKNIGSQVLNLTYYVYWYDKNGVTQPFSANQEYQRVPLALQPQQTAVLPLMKPTTESVQYRLYFSTK
ncbi:MAG: YcfL family protein [Lonepinella koalarum]|nr:YcfL family protein [Lonepinella koalarum]